MLTFKEYLIESQYSFEYHDTLNNKIWSDNVLKPKVHDKLLKIAHKYFESLKVSPDYHIIDIIITGSLANYNYTKYSDIDLHIIIDKSPDYCDNCGLNLEDVFKTKKDLWGKKHEITIYGYPVECYAQLQSEKLEALGVYSIKNNKWNIKPRHIDNLKKKINNYVINVKSKHIKHQIDNLTNKDQIKIKNLKDKIKSMRKAALHRSGEFAIENLVFKDLRNTGYLDKLDKIEVEAFDKSLSL